MNQSESKLCNTCNAVKPLTEFSKQSSSKTGYKYRCKTCDKRYFDQYYAQKSAQVMVTVRKWQDKNFLKVAEHKKKYKDKKLLEESQILPNSPPESSGVISDV